MLADRTDGSGRKPNPLPKVTRMTPGAFAPWSSIRIALVHAALGGLVVWPVTARGWHIGLVLWAATLAVLRFVFFWSQRHGQRSQGQSSAPRSPDPDSEAGALSEETHGAAGWPYWMNPLFWLGAADTAVPLLLLAVGLIVTLTSGPGTWYLGVLGTTFLLLIFPLAQEACGHGEERG